MTNWEIGDDHVQWNGDPEVRSSFPPRLHSLMWAAPIALLPLWWLAAKHDFMDRTLVTMLFVVAAVGFVLTATALGAKRFRLERVRLDARGLEVAFSTVPGLLSHRTMSRRLVPWWQVSLVKFGRVPDQGMSFCASLREPLFGLRSEVDLGPCVSLSADWIAKAQSLLPAPIQRSAEFDNWGTEWQAGHGFAEWAGKAAQPEQGTPPRLRLLYLSLAQGVLTFSAAYLVDYGWLFAVLLVWGLCAWCVVGAALFSDRFRVHRLRVERDGLEFEFSRVPGLFQRVEHGIRQVPWKDVQHVKFSKSFGDGEGTPGCYAFTAGMQSRFAGRHKELSVSTHGHFERSWFDNVLTLLPSEVAQAARFENWYQAEPATNASTTSRP